MLSDLGYLPVPRGMLTPAEDINRVPAGKLLIICTGSQGEPTSALTKIANGDHRLVSIQPHDTVILSSTPIGGNGQAVYRNIDNLLRRGADVLYQGKAQVHVSGHGSREEIKLMLALLKPRYGVPVHGEYRMLVEHARLAVSMGTPQENVIVAQDGDIIEASARDGIRIVDHVPSGNVFVDWLGAGDVGQVVLRDRKALSQDGILVVMVTVNSETDQPSEAADPLLAEFCYPSAAPL